MDLVYLFVGLQDNLDLERFEERRQAVLVGLVACCPSEAASPIFHRPASHDA